VQIGLQKHRAASYFLVSVSTRLNLDLCIRHGLAGFPSSPGGAWTFEEIQEGDFVSFLYGAKAHNLYRVAKREAIRGAHALLPWPVITSRESQKTYYFPFRLVLEPTRQFTESLVRQEFAYVAENLLLRGGYRKTHFQADQTTLQSASQLGELAGGKVERLTLSPYETFVPKYSAKKEEIKIPEVMPFTELILQAAIRLHLCNEANLASFLSMFGIQELAAASLEALGEKALLRGHIDILLKERVPVGSALTIPIEVKSRAAQQKDVAQLASYVEELGPECAGAALVAAKFGKATIRQASSQGIKLVRYTLDVDLSSPVAFGAICRGLSLQAVL